MARLALLGRAWASQEGWMSTTQAVAATAPSVKRKGLKRRQKETVAFYFFILPWILGFLIFVFTPMIASAYLSFTQFSVMSPPEWIGVANFVQMFQTPLFWQSLGNTLFMVALDLPLGLLAALAAAVLLNQKLRGINVFRTIFYLPALIPAIANVLLWVWIFDKDSGILNVVLKLVGLPPQPWLTDPYWSKPSLIFMNLWGIGSAMLIYLAGLKGIPAEVHEAGKIDGANSSSLLEDHYSAADADNFVSTGDRRHLRVPNLHPGLYPGRWAKLLDHLLCARPLQQRLPLSEDGLCQRTGMGLVRHHPGNHLAGFPLHPLLGLL